MLFRGIVVGAASGKFGALVASHNKGGQYLRARIVPSGRIPTAQQSQVRNAVASLSAQWGSTLDDSQRAGWGEYALNVPSTNALGDSIQLSGQNWFIACNTPLIQADIAPILDAPTIFDRGTPTILPVVTALTDAGGTITLGATLAGTCTILTYMGHPYGPGRNKYYGSFQLTGVAEGVASASAVTFTPAFPIGTDPAKVAFKLVFSQTDGRLSTPQWVTFQQ